jgi:hypothetical protein
MEAEGRNDVAAILRLKRSASLRKVTGNTAAKNTKARTCAMM